MTIKSFWGNLNELEIVRTPKKILQEQAGFLTTATEGSLIGQVDDQRTMVPDFTYSLEVRVPSLNNYTFTLLSIEHSLELYPLQVMRYAIAEPSIRCRNQAAFESLLEGYLSSKEVKSILSKLLSQAR